jgi:hypothetical protein
MPSGFTLANTDGVLCIAFKLLALIPRNLADLKTMQSPSTMHIHLYNQRGTRVTTQGNNLICKEFFNV